MSLIVAATGHRPKDFTEDYGVVTLKANIKMRYANASRLICGMAAGFDLLAGDAAIELGIPITAAIPWDGHRETLPKEWQPKWDIIFEYADQIAYVNDTKPNGRGQYAQFLHARNHWMVDRADVVMAYWNPEKQEGGTYETIQYALKKEVPCANIWNDPPF